MNSEDNYFEMQDAVKMNKDSLKMNEDTDTQKEVKEIVEYFRENMLEIKKEPSPKYNDEGSPIIPVKSRSTRVKIIERLLFNKHKFEDRQELFNVMNTISLALTLYNLSSIINIEGQQSLKLYDQTAILNHFHWKKQGLTLYYLIIILILVHGLKVLTCLLGYFCVVQKSGRLLTIFMMLSFLCVITRGIITILLIIDYKQIQSVCLQVFGDADNVADIMATQFAVILGLFMSVEVIIGIYSLLLAGSAKKRYRIMRMDEKKMATHYTIGYNILIRQYII